MTILPGAQTGYAYELKQLGQALGVHDAWLLSALHAFGIRETTACLVSWLPVIEAGWIGGLTEAERLRVMGLIHADLPELPSEGEQLLGGWLAECPSATLFRAARCVFLVHLQHLPATDALAARTRLLAVCADVAGRHRP